MAVISLDKSKIPLFPMLLTAFIDLLGVGIVIPVLPALFLDLSSGIFPQSFGVSGRAIILGLLMASYPFAQFIGAPIIGALSDRKGRKPVLVLSLVGTLIGYVLFALGIIYSNLWILFFSRLLDGFTGGNISTIYSAIADISNEKEKIKRFGYVGMAFGLGFILGPFIGGTLSGKNLFSYFHYSMPFWFVAVLCFINILLVLYKFPETLKNKINSKMDPLIGFKNTAKAFKIPNMRTLFTVSFILAFGFNLFVQFFSIYLISKFEMNQNQVGRFFAYVGIWIAVSQGILAGYVSRKMDAVKVLPPAIFLLATSIIILTLPERYTFMLLLLPFVAIFQGIITPNINAAISNQADQTSQGEVLGINQSLVSLSQIFPPIIDGFLFSISVDLPIIFSGICTILGGILLVVFYSKNKMKKFSEIQNGA